MSTSEPSASLRRAGGRERRLGRRLDGERCVLHILGADPEDERCALDARTPRAIGDHVVGDRETCARRSSTIRPPSRGQAAALTMFIAGEPMKPATKRFAGPVVERSRRVDLLERARRA